MQQHTHQTLSLHLIITPLLKQSFPEPYKQKKEQSVPYPTMNTVIDYLNLHTDFNLKALTVYICLENLAETFLSDFRILPSKFGEMVEKSQCGHLVPGPLALWPALLEMSPGPYPPRPYRPSLLSGWTSWCPLSPNFACSENKRACYKKQQKENGF